MLRKSILCISAVLVLAPLAGLPLALAKQPAAPNAPITSTVRIGVYDSRAIAVAYAASRHNPVTAKTAERDAARQAGDTKKVAELERWGSDFQQQLHFQGFCRVPVHNLLEPVQPQLQQLLSTENLVAIVDQTDAISPGSTTIDVTAKLVELYQPSDRTRKMAADITQAPVQPLSAIARMKH